MSSPPLQWQGQDVDATTIDGRMGDLWTQLTHSDAAPGAVRTHVYNLVVYAGNPAHSEPIRQTLHHLAERHPSRAIVLLTDRSNPRTSLDAEVTVQCISPPASSVTLCHEQVTVTAHGRVADHLTSVVIPLLMPELRTYLWWPGQPAFSHRTFGQLLSIADQLVLDSAQFASPGDGFSNLSRLCQARQGVNDFHWARLLPWREVIAQFFDGPIWAKYALAIRSILIEFGAGGRYERATASTLLTLGWMASELGWQVETSLDNLVDAEETLAVVSGERVIPIEVRVRDAGEKARGRLLRFEIVSQPRDEAPARFTIERQPDLQHATVTTHVHDGPQLSRVVPLSGESDPEILAMELERAGHDKMYEKVVDMAGKLAGREIWLPA